MSYLSGNSSLTPLELCDTKTDDGFKARFLSYPLSTVESPSFVLLSNNSCLAALAFLRSQLEADMQPNEDGPGVTFDRSISQLKRTVLQLREAKFVTGLLEKLGVEGVTKQTCLRRFIVLGLGSPSNSTVARLQLSLALILVEYLCLDVSAMELYDPVFTPVDEILISHLGELGGTFGNVDDCIHPQNLHSLRNQCRGASPTLLTRESSGRYAGPDAELTKVPTFWFMPHCEADLYENVLKANWGSPSIMQSHIFLGNNFATYAERWAERQGNPGCPHHILAAANRLRLCLKVHLEGSSSPVETAAFGDTSVQIVDSTEAFIT